VNRRGISHRLESGHLVSYQMFMMCFRLQLLCKLFGYATGCYVVLCQLILYPYAVYTGGLVRCFKSVLMTDRAVKKQLIQVT